MIDNDYAPSHEAGIYRNDPDLNISFNGARYSFNGGRFFTTDLNTTDKDVAKLFKFTIDKCKEIYKIEPKKEMIILDYDGEIDIDTFIIRNYSFSTERNL